jgi:hypothetical protein
MLMIYSNPYIHKLFQFYLYIIYSYISKLHNLVIIIHQIIQREDDVHP